MVCIYKSSCNNYIAKSKEPLKKNFININNKYSNRNAVTSGDGKYLAYNTFTKDGIDIYVAKKDASGNWARPKKQTMYHNGSQADDLDSPIIQNDVFPPAPIATNRPTNDIHSMQNEVDMQMAMGPMAANSVLGGSFGSSF